MTTDTTAPTQRQTRRDKATRTQAQAIAGELMTGVPARTRWKDRLGWYEASAAPVKSTTRQTEALRLGVSARPGSERALVLAVDLDTGEIVFSDPISDYAMPDGPSSPTRLTLGGVGMGKSSFLKTNACLRPLLLGRRVVIVDKKLQKNGLVLEGEYAPLARRLGSEPLRFATDGTGLKINILDPAIQAAARGDAGAGQTDLLRAILGEALGRPLDELEGKALRTAHRVALEHAGARGRVADIRDVLPALLNPEATEGASAGDLRQWGLVPAFALERMVEEDLAGLVDGPTDERIQLQGALTVFDISALPEDGAALPIAMAILNTWLTGTLRRQKALVPTHFGVEEGWHLVQGGFGLVARRNSKLARGVGLVPEYAIHHLSDIPAESPAMAMCREAGHVLMFQQSIRMDAEQCVQTYSLPAESVSTLLSLPKGSALFWQSTRRPRIVQMVRSDFEREVTDTDSAMISAATMSDLREELEASLEDLPSATEVLGSKQGQ